MISLLRDLRQQVSRSGQDRIDELLASVGVIHRPGEQQLANRSRLSTMLLMLQQLPYNKVRLMIITTQLLKTSGARPVRARKSTALPTWTYPVRTLCQQRNLELMIALGMLLRPNDRASGLA